MRARLALAYSGVAVTLREVVLKNKPEQLLQVSIKGTVPVLLLPDGQMLDESRDIMIWACKQSDPDDWLKSLNHPLIHENDTSFKQALDGYKYADRFPEHPQHVYRNQCEVFLHTIEKTLQSRPFIDGQQASFVDVAIFPFIRQFSMVDAAWFAGISQPTPFPNTFAWMQYFLQHSLFKSTMKKYPAWQAGDDPIVFSNDAKHP